LIRHRPTRRSAKGQGLRGGRKKSSSLSPSRDRELNGHLGRSRPVKAKLGKGHLGRSSGKAPYIPQHQLPRPFEIGWVPPQEYEEALESPGSIEDWRKELENLARAREELELREKAKIRPHITGIVVSLWTSFTIVCIIRFAFTGDALPLVMPAVLSGPLSTILMFYYGRTPPGNGGGP